MRSFDGIVIVTVRVPRLSSDQRSESGRGNDARGQAEVPEQGRRCSCELRRRRQVQRTRQARLMEHQN